MVFRTLVTAVAAVVTTHASAQDENSTENGKIEEVVITANPIRDSQQAALDAKRFADNVVDVVSSDTIGRFPDQNIADSLSRLPGIAVERDQGQARYLNMRGAPFRWTGIAFDGIDVPGAENGRIPRFDSLPATITSQINANKAVLPSMPGESVAGYIDIKTFNPFAVDGVSLALDVGWGEQDLGGGDVSRTSVRGSWSNESFGVVGFYSRNLREQVTDNREYELERDESGQLVVNNLDFRSYFVDREDSAYGGRIEYRGDDGGALKSVFLSTLYTEFIDDEQRNQWDFDVLSPQPGVARDDVTLEVSRLLQDGSYENSTFTNTLGADFAFGDWRLEARLNYTETEFFFRIPLPQSVDGLTSGSFDLSDEEDPLLFLSDPLDSIEYASTRGLDFASELNIDAWKYKLDIDRDMEFFGRESTVEFGFMYDQRESTGFDQALNFDFAFPVNPSDFDTGRLWDSNTTNTIGGTYYDNVGLRNAWEAAGGVGPVDVPDDAIVTIDEDIISVYAMATTNFDWGNVVYGLRLEHTDYLSKGPTGDSFLSVNDDFLNVLPSVHLNVDLSEDLKLRLSGTSGVNRPTYNEWRASASFDVAEREAGGGNPFLDPEEALGADVSLEWYYATASILSVGAFYRTIDNVIYEDVTTVDGGIYLPAAAGEQWTLSATANGSNGELRGLEANLMFSAVDFIDGPLSGLGFSFNLTLIDSEFDTIRGDILGLPGTSDAIYNASLFYENYGFSARINYQFREEWISPIEDPSEVWGDMERVDATIQYELPVDLSGARATVYANFNNITDETDVRFDGNGTINQSEAFGRRYLFGLRVNF
ncbi:MAG: TonB-dependent receptor [Pseudomonadota bacterium]